MLVDAREADVFAIGHLAGAVYIWRGVLEFKLSANRALKPRGLKAVLHCKTRGSAALAAVALHDLGYLSVQSLAGGFDAWVAAGRPVAKPEVPSYD